MHLVVIFFIKLKNIYFPFTYLIDIGCSIFLFFTFVVKSIIVTKNDIGEQNGFLGNFFYHNPIAGFERENFH